LSEERVEHSQGVERAFASGARIRDVTGFDLRNDDNVLALRSAFGVRARDRLRRESARVEQDYGGSRHNDNG
jgi:hypothetical protein